MPWATFAASRAAGGAPSRPVYQVTSIPGIQVEVLDLGLACCALEFGAAVVRGLLVPAGEGAQAQQDVIPVTARVLVVSGTVTHALMPAVTAALASASIGPTPAAPGADVPCHVLAFGACAISGGPYWDAPTVAPGVVSALDVASYVPGCPPRPEALIEAICELASAGTAAPLPARADP